MQQSIDTNAFKLIKWSDDPNRLKEQLTQFAWQISLWCAAVNQALANPAAINALLGITQFTQPWTPFTCVITPGAGSGVTSTSNSSYLQIGKTVFFNLNVTITAIGTASGAQFFTVPFAPKRNMTFVVRENNVNGLQFSMVFGTTTGQIFTNANANPTWQLSNYAGSIVYETN